MRLNYLDLSKIWHHNKLINDFSLFLSNHSDNLFFKTYTSGNYFKEIVLDKEVQVVTNEEIEVQRIMIDIDYFAWCIQLIIWCGVVMIVISQLE